MLFQEKFNVEKGLPPDIYDREAKRVMSKEGKMNYNIPDFSKHLMEHAPERYFN